MSLYTMTFELPWEDPDLVLRAGDRVYLSVDQLVTVRQYVDRLRRLASVVRAAEMDLRAEGFDDIADALADLDSTPTDLDS